MVDYDDIDVNERLISIDLGNNKINMKRTDPYGFWTIGFDKGQVPEKLRGLYTSAEVARRAVTAYLDEKGRTPVTEK